MNSFLLQVFLSNCKLLLNAMRKYTTQQLGKEIITQNSQRNLAIQRKASNNDVCISASIITHKYNERN